MLIGIGASIYSGHRYDAAISSANLAARFDAALGITSSGGFASAWADQSGNGRSLLQATGANQPIHLAYSGTKYGWLPGVASNYFSTPDAVANRFTGDQSIVVSVTLPDYTPSANQMLVSGYVGASAVARKFYLLLLTTGVLRFSWESTVPGDVNTDSTVALSTVVSDGVKVTIGLSFDVDNGSTQNEIKFWYSLDDETSWTQLGTTVTAAGVASRNAGTAAIQIGAFDGTGSIAIGSFHSMRLYAGVPSFFNGAGSSTPVVNFDPSRWTTGSTFTASTGETWTINSTGSKPAQIVDRPSLLFDGAAHCMKTAAFTLNQPETVYLVAKQVGWTNGRYLFDGNASDSVLLMQTTASPQFSMYAGSFAAANANAAIGSKAVICSQFNGASSSNTVNATTATTGNAGAGNAGGFTLAANASGAGFSNIQAYEALIYSTAHDAETRANVIRALMSKHGVA